MKKTSCTAIDTFADVLNTIHETGTTTRAALMTDPDLYSKLWFTLQDFSHSALLSKTGGKNAKGESRLGNAQKVDFLERSGVTEREDLEMECVAKIVEKLDLVLRQPVGKQKNYCYTICNHLVDDYCRKFLPVTSKKVVSLEDFVKGNAATGEEKAYTYGDIIPDCRYDPQRMHIEYETISDLEKQRQEKQANERAEKKQNILRELPIIAPRASEVFAHLACTYLGIKPNALAKRIVCDGYERVCEQVIQDVSATYGVDVESVRRQNIPLKETKDRGLVRLNSEDLKVSADLISKYASRAKKRLMADNQGEK